MSEQLSNRGIYVNNEEKNRSKRFATNQVNTTKYTPLNFLAYFLFHELSRPANIFFCLIIIIQTIDPSEVDKISTVVPLSIVLAFTGIKEIYEDYRRSKIDQTANQAIVHVLKDGKFTPVHCETIKVGDIVKVTKGSRFPADIVLLASSEPQGIAYLETSNVDGESNLKIRTSNPKTSYLIDEESLADMNAVIQCEEPNERIYFFEGNMELNSEKISLDQSNLLLRGAGLKNTRWIHGVVVYTGHETKIMMNSSSTPYKRTKMDRKTDQQYEIISFMLLFLTLFGAFGNWYYDTLVFPKHWYLNISETVGIKKDWGLITYLRTMLTYLLLLNTLVPISLSVTLEFIKFVMAHLVNNDIDLYDEETDTTAVAKSSNLMEELGQIQCILTDKTGTLTRNEMILKNLMIDGEKYMNCDRDDTEVISLASESERIDFFLKILSICHTVMIDESDPSNPCFQGSSPDELAMVNVASHLKYKFVSRSSGTMTIEIRGKLITVDVFAVIEFTSARKRMSTVVMLPDGNYYIFTKGADSVILNRLGKDSASSEIVQKSTKGLEDFAGTGLRTLCFAYRKLDKDFALEWLDKWHDALNTVSERQNVIDSVAELIESDLVFIGATGVEDRLQEEVPETIELLTKANIKIWMLTGDRFETAVSTAFLSNLIQSTTIQLHLLDRKREVIAKSLDNFLSLIDNEKSASKSSFALVANGSVVELILSDDFTKSDDMKKLEKIVSSCKTLLFCRLSPLQKSQITRFARNQLKFVTLAVGDGGNDVSMIQAANVGVGISGKEGLQASRSADFSIAKFKYLKKLVLVHGSWSLHRLSRVVMYSIYKNFVLFFTQLWFCFYNGFSAQTVFEPWMLINWNLVFTCWPPTIIGLTDQYVNATELIENPQLYEFGQKNKFYDSKTFWKSALNAIFHSFLIFFTVALICPEGMTLTSGRTSTMLMFGSTIFAIILSVVCLKILLFTNYLTFALAATVVASACAWYFFILTGPKILPGFLPNASTKELFSEPSFWALLLLVPVLVSLRDFLWKFYRRQFRPHPYHIVQELKIKKPGREKDQQKPSKKNLIFINSSAKPSQSRGFSFSQTFGQSRVLQAYGQSPKLTSNVRTTTKVDSEDI